MHLRRTAAQVRILSRPAPPASITEARLVLNDISPHGLSLFCPNPMTVGFEVAVTLDEPVRVYVKGRIVSCLEFDTSQHIVSSQSFSYRVGVLLQFETDEEKTAFKEFCEMIAANYVFVARAA